MKRGFALMLLLGIMAATSDAAPILTFYTDKDLFDQQTTTALIDFEGIAPDDGFVLYDDAVVIDPPDGEPVTFTTPYLGAYTGALLIADEEAKNDQGVYINGAPFKSDLIIANFYQQPLTAELPTGITAVGGFFGKLFTTGNDNPRNPFITIEFESGASETFDSDDYLVKNMGADGQLPNFFGWVVSGDTITSISHQLPNSSMFEWVGIDNFQYGHQSNNIVPEPASCVVWSLIGLCFVGAGWWRRRTAA